jgi:hypothetical protein
MINYVNILGVWDIIEKGYIPKLNENTKKLTVEFKIEKKHNDYIVNIILNSVSESKRFLFDDMTSVYNMWCALINVYEDNNQVEIEVKVFPSESEDEQEQNLALMVNAKECSSPNVIDEITVVFKNKKMETQQQASRSIS